MTPEQQKELAPGLSNRPVADRQSVAAQLVTRAQEQSIFIRGLDGQVYAVPRGGLGLAQPIRGAGSFREHLARDFFEATRLVASANAKTDAMAILAAGADETDPRPVYQRVAPLPGGLLIDLGRSDQQMVEVNSNGWTVRQLQAGDPWMKRTTQMGVLPVPTAGAVDPLWTYLNVQEEDRPVLRGWMACTFLPEVAQPWLLLRGEQGTGKTTAANQLLTLLDPGAGQMTAPPRKDQDLAVAAQGRTVLGLDNLSSMPDSLSDAICRAVTGESIVTRALYSDGDQFILRYRIGLIVTAIDPGALRGDLAERMLPIQLEPLGERRRSEKALQEAFDAARPALLGSILDDVAAALRNNDAAASSCPTGGWPRLADFGQVLAALDIEHGTVSLTSYLATMADSERDVASGHPLVEAVMHLVKTGPWSGTPTELLGKLQDGQLTQEQRREWSTAAKLTQCLNRLSKNLRGLGVIVDTRARSNGKRLTKLSLADASAYVAAKPGPRFGTPPVPSSEGPGAQPPERSAWTTVEQRRTRVTSG